MNVKDLKMATKKKPEMQSGTKSAKKSKKKSAPVKLPSKKAVKRAVVALVTPWVLVIFSLIFAVILILALVEGDVGELGEGIISFFSAIFGVASYALPVVLGYVGVRWCYFNIAYDYKERKSSEDYARAAKSLTIAAVNASLLLIFASAFIGVLADQSYFDIASFWEDGWDGTGGGVVGGTLGFVFLNLGAIPAIILLVIIIAICALFAVGLTPNYVLRKVRENHLANVANRVQTEEDDEEEIPTAPKAQTKKQAKPSKSQEADEQPAPKQTAPQFTHVPPVFEESDTEFVPLPKTAEQNEDKQPAPVDNGPLDFGGDSTFDTNEFDNIDNIIKDFGTPIAPSPTEDDPTPKVSTPANIELTQMDSEELLSDMEAVALDESAEDVPEIITPYIFPSVELLAKNKEVDTTDHTKELQDRANILVETLKSFRVGVQSVTYSRGPTITRYELKPEVGTRVRSIANLVDDIALNLATAGVRIEAPIPGKAAVGIEVPNETRATVYLRDLIDNPKFTDSKSKLTAALGMDVGGNPIYFDIGKMPHLLIAGTTGSGKSICINCVIMSILYKAKPEEVKLILIDPKKVEFNMYKNIPHLYCPIVSEPKKAAGALASAVAEMERRFELIEAAGVRDIASYNAAAETDPDLEFMPHMVIIIDELADLMMTARDEVETSICRLAQKARAAGIHVILGTQRPSVDVITGLIKATVPSRIACTVMSQVDSRTIIDVAGAESLIGRGDMLFAPVGSTKPLRVQGAFVSDGEVERIVTFIKDNNGQARYNADFVNRIEEEAAKCGMGKKGASAGGDAGGSELIGDSKFSDAVRVVIEAGKASTSLLQRRINVGYGRAAKMLDTMEELGYIGAQDGNKPRQVLISMDEYLRRVAEGTIGDE